MNFDPKLNEWINLPQAYIAIFWVKNSEVWSQIEWVNKFATSLYRIFWVKNSEFAGSYLSPQKWSKIRRVWSGFFSKTWYFNEFCSVLHLLVQSETVIHTKNGRHTAKFYAIVWLQNIDVFNEEFFRAKKLLRLQSVLGKNRFSKNVTFDVMEGNEHIVFLSLICTAWEKKRKKTNYTCPAVKSTSNVKMLLSQEETTYVFFVNKELLFVVVMFLYIYFSQLVWRLWKWWKKGQYEISISEQRIFSKSSVPLRNSMKQLFLKSVN